LNEIRRQKYLDSFSNADSFVYSPVLSARSHHFLAEVQLSLMEREDVTTLIGIEPNELIPDTVAAEMLGVKRATLAQWRSRGLGPAYVKIGRFIRYHRPDIATFIAQRRRDPADPSAAA
jgi:predicted DNA-binding transcriptional regulator AlpA